MLQFVTDIIQKKTHCYFISPHLDDAALSCAGLLTTLAPHTNVTIITVFTKATETKLTLSAKKSLQLAGFPTPASYYEARREEDLKAFATLPVEIIHLNEIEALYRRKTHQTALMRFVGNFIPELLFRYPTYKFHMTRGAIAQDDEKLIEGIQKKLFSIISKEAVCFAPLGVGKHVDHLVVHKACELFQPIYWLDQPYLDREPTSQAEALIKRAEHFDFSQEKKQAIIRNYTSQIRLLFPSADIASLSEHYIVPR